jgi:hypothetical protein
MCNNNYITPVDWETILYGFLSRSVFSKALYELL